MFMRSFGPLFLRCPGSLWEAHWKQWNMQLARASDGKRLSEVLGLPEYEAQLGPSSLVPSVIFSG